MERLWNKDAQQGSTKPYGSNKSAVGAVSKFLPSSKPKTLTACPLTPAPGAIAARVRVSLSGNAGSGAFGGMGDFVTALASSVAKVIILWGGGLYLNAAACLCC